MQKWGAPIFYKNIFNILLVPYIVKYFNLKNIIHIWN